VPYSGYTVLSKFAVPWSVVLRITYISLISLSLNWKFPSFSWMLKCLLAVRSAKFWEEQISPVFKSDTHKLLKCKNIPANELKHKTKVFKILTPKSNKMQKCFKIYYSIFKWSSTSFGRHNAHRQEPKTALAASGFVYVEGCWTCGCCSTNAFKYWLIALETWV